MKSSKAEIVCSQRRYLSREFRTSKKSQKASKIWCRQFLDLAVDSRKDAIKVAEQWVHRATRGGRENTYGDLQAMNTEALVTAAEQARNDAYENPHYLLSLAGAGLDHAMEEVADVQGILKDLDLEFGLLGDIIGLLEQAYEEVKNQKQQLLKDEKEQK